MKAILLILPLAGATMLAAATDPPRPATNDVVTSLSAKTTTEATRDSVASTSPDAEVVRFSEQLDLAAAITLKPPRPAGGPVLSLFNPLAPVAPEPATRWTTRASWLAVGETAGKMPSATERRHEPRFGIMLCGR